MLIKAVLEQKQRGGVITMEASNTVLAAIQKMYEEKVGALLIQSERGETVGIVTERDILRFCVSRSTEIGKAKVNEVMTKNPAVVTLDSTIDQAESVMTEKRCRHLPVVADGKVVGIVSIGDVVKAKLTETAVEAKYLIDYITIS
jgi:CBS domain-containing protein